MILLIIAIFGLLVPNGIFIYWLLTEFHSFSQFYTDKLALGFILDCFLAMFLLAYWFAVNPIGKIKWYWFIVLSLIGGLGFSLPFYYWLNKKQS
ncbi:MAG: DUF2834 domain-containing protein [Pyrinomonadaceae bacterium]|nr:DUF2834 domain-containing protein [Pyrinomonadaceae bacterium]